jgi:hypothetical protein
MPSDWFPTASGRRVLLEQFHVERFALGVLEGRPDLIRRIQIERLPERIRELFPGRTAYLVVAPPEPPLRHLTYVPGTLDRAQCTPVQRHPAVEGKLVNVKSIESFQCDQHPSGSDP